MLIGIVIGNKRVRWEWGISLFIIIAATSTIFSANRGVSIQIVRGLVELWILAAATLTYIETEKNIGKIFSIYLFAFIFFGIWGISGHGLILAFMPLNNEDSFGPFMCMGISMCYFISLNEEKWKRKVLWMGQYVCILGAIVSFARGTFIALVAILIYILLRTKKKKIFILEMVICGIIGISLILNFRPDFMKNYSAEMSTIWEEGEKEQTANDRVFLWIKGLEMFLDNPFLGVGPGCYSFRLARYTSRMEAEEWGVNTQIYGRHLHNIYIEVMAEMGFLGTVGLLAILIQFLRNNNFLRREKKVKLYKNEGNTIRFQETQTGRFRFWGLGLEGAMVGYLINGIFYNLLFFPWLWDLVILNTIVFNLSKSFQGQLDSKEPRFPELYDSRKILVD